MAYVNMNPPAKKKGSKVVPTMFFRIRVFRLAKTTLHFCLFGGLSTNF